MSVLNRRAIAALVVAAAAALGGTTACTTQSDDADGKLIVGFVVDPSWSHIPVAQQAGYFADRGLDVEVVNFSTGVEALQTLTARQVDVTTAAAVPTSAAVVKSPELRVVADGARWNGGRIVARRDSGVARLADLNGKKVGAPQGTSGAFFADSVLAQAGVTAQQVQVAPSAIVTAATQGNVDAVSIFQPYQAQVIAALGDDAVVLEESGGSFVDHCLYLTTAATATDKAEDLSAFFAALDAAGADLAAGTEGSVAAVSAATQLDPALVSGVLAEYDFALELRPSLAEELAAKGAWAKKAGNIDASVTLPDYGQFLDAQFLGQPAPA
ncbi:ABC transporter substrate-binding protein [[Mycobacterium] wendilense]|uniref:ABC transporter substrate-binding protein n=1 Tax=[Mycobacterium] wendilense TaxID=3064284 RepID=A0ABM9MJM7_9MYCO|nr:ABC transporter substrate-binding protein [Mycolicibacterium sp. MU0050]CAJ1586812.1 ABC transporter substrate-binding protein [Mycolicibacterium sp. MU0050]